MVGGRNGRKEMNKRINEWVWFRVICLVEMIFRGKRLGDDFKSSI